MTFYMREEGSDHPFHYPTWKMASEQFILYRTTIFFFAIHSAVLETHNLEGAESNRSMSFIALHLFASLNLAGLS